MIIGAHNVVFMCEFEKSVAPANLSALCIGFNAMIARGHVFICIDRLDGRATDRACTVKYELHDIARQHWRHYSGGKQHICLPRVKHTEEIVFDGVFSRVFCHSYLDFCCSYLDFGHAQLVHRIIHGRVFIDDFGVNGALSCQAHLLCCVYFMYINMIIKVCLIFQSMLCSNIHIHRRGVV
jgi:hypothetical protein